MSKPTKQKRGLRLPSDEVRVLTVDQLLTLATVKFRREVRVKHGRSATPQELSEFKRMILAQAKTMNDSALSGFQADRQAKSDDAKKN